MKISKYQKAICFMPWEEKTYYGEKSEQNWVATNKSQHTIMLLKRYINQEAYRAFVIFEGKMYYGNWWPGGDFTADSRQPTDRDFFPADQLMPNLPSKYLRGRHKKITTEIRYMHKSDKVPKGAWTFSICPHCSGIIRAIRKTCPNCNNEYKTYIVSNKELDNS